MKVAGVEAPPSVLADLALQLHVAGEKGLALQVGIALDRELDQLHLSRRDCEDIVRAIDMPPTELRELHDALLRRCRQRDRTEG